MSNNYYIFGLGKSGIATAKFLAARNLNFIAYDDNDDARASLQAQISTPVVFKNYTEIDFKTIKTLVLAPGIPLLNNPHKIVELAKNAGCEIICDVELLHRFARLEAKNSSFVGITGTNGKSTTTALIHFILKECGLDAEIGGNFGIPALDLNIKDGKIYVIETSSFQLDLLAQARYNVSILLNITPDHIDRYGSYEGYINSKKQIFNNQQAGDEAIICTYDEICAGIATELKASSKAKIIAYKTAEVLKGVTFDNLPGEHNRQNIYAAFCVAKFYGLDDDKIIAAIRKFPPLKHRLQFIKEVNGVKFINDSKATNASSTSHALKAFNNIFWLAGGIAKEGGIEELAPLFGHVTKTFLYGKCAAEFAETLKKNNQNYEVFENLEQATKAAYSEAKNHQPLTTSHQPVVLLSPATASFDQFKSFEHRGDVFIDLVSGL
jgi:UDP-N-acetylmuramoylalanine--D-glutamate ligase